MALFTDGTPADIEYLRSYESSILDVADAEGIDLDAKLGLAADEIGDTILRFLLNEGTRESQNERRRIGLRGVVITPAMRRWHAVRTLEAVYRDAFGNQLNERYEKKLREYSDAVRRASDEFFQIGVGLVSRPVGQPLPPTAGGSAVSTGSYFVQITWVDAAGQEGAPSDPVMLDIGAGSTIAGAAPDQAAVSWNIYLGTARGNAVLQNSAPLDLSATWTFSGTPAGGRAVPGGQQPDYFIANHQSVLRG